MSVSKEKKEILRDGIFNVGLRGITLGSRFLLIFFLARALTPAEVGIYGLFAAANLFALYLLGLDFYAFSTRDMLSRPRAEWPIVIRNQVVFYLFVYVIATPLVLFVFYFGFLPWDLLIWFVALLLLEHLCQEGYRLLVAIGCPVLAGWSFFFRFGAWAYFIAAVFLFAPDRANLELVWISWFVGCLISLSFILYALSRLDWGVIAGVGIDLPWMKRGVKIALPFLLATLALRGVYFFDRYILDYYLNKDLVGVYTLFVGFAAALESFVDSGVAAFTFPGLVSSYRQTDYLLYRNRFRKMCWLLAGTIAVYTILALVLIRPILLMIGQPIYLDYLGVFYILLMARVVFCSSLGAQLSLYVRGLDLRLNFVTVSGFAVFVFCAMPLTEEYGIFGVAWAQFAAMLWMLSGKTLMAWFARAR